MSAFIVLAMRALPYIIVVSIVLGMFWSCYHKGYLDAKIKYELILSQRDNDNKVSREKAIEAVRVEEKAAYTAHAAINKQLHEDNQNAINSRDDTINSLRSDALKLRKQFTCPTTVNNKAGVNTAQPGHNDQAESGLSRTDAEFLIREAGRADDYTRQLNACIDALETDRRIYNNVVTE